MKKFYDRKSPPVYLDMAGELFSTTTPISCETGAAA